MFCFILAYLVSFVSSITTDCSASNSLFKIEELRFVPENPHVGENTTLYLTYNNPGLPVGDGTATTSVKYSFIPITPTVEPLCKNTQCPILAGQTEQASSSLWPDVKGTVTIRSVWNDLDGNELLCFQIKEITMGNSVIEYEGLEGL
jgi:ML domain